MWNWESSDFDSDWISITDSISFSLLLNFNSNSKNNLINKINILITSNFLEIDWMMIKSYIYFSIIYIINLKIFFLLKIISWNIITFFLIKFYIQYWFLSSYSINISIFALKSSFFHNFLEIWIYIIISIIHKCERFDFFLYQILYNIIFFKVFIEFWFLR